MSLMEHWFWYGSTLIIQFAMPFVLGAIFLFLTRYFAGFSHRPYSLRLLLAQGAFEAEPLFLISLVTILAYNPQKHSTGGL